MAFSFLQPTASAAWWNGSWSYCRNITIPSNKVTTTLTDFPALLVLNSSRINYANTQNSGQDLRVVNAGCGCGGTDIPHEIEKWNEAGDSPTWVKISSLSSSSDTVHSIYYGNAGASDGQNVTGVWDKNTTLRYDMSDTTTSTVTDSTSFDNDGTKASANNPVEIAGMIGDAQDFVTSDYITTPNIHLDISNEITYSAWVYPEHFNSADFVGIMTDRFVSGKIQFVMYHSGNNYGGGIYNGGWANCIIAGTDKDTDVWKHITATYNGTAIVVYKNGALAKYCATTRGLYGVTSAFDIGRRWDNYGSTLYYWNGTIDEARVSNAARSADWINQSYLSETDKMITYGSEESAPSGNSCTCPASGNWIGTCSDNCTITTDCDLQGNNITITGGSGTWIFEGKVHNYTAAYVDCSTYMNLSAGGVFGW